MPHIPYADFAEITDPEIRAYLERARREGAPRPESQAIRANNPNVIRAFSQAWDLDPPFTPSNAFRCHLAATRRKRYDSGKKIHR
jgi:hypothetical protein